LDQGLPPHQVLRARQYWFAMVALLDSYVER
jgi:hypothetical protein